MTADQAHCLADWLMRRGKRNEIEARIVDSGINIFIATTRPITRWEAASNQLTENYLAPVPSQFMHTPRAMERAGSVETNGYSVFGYIRALATDCIAITGGNMDAPV